jgi:hypothetical protein
MTKKSIIQFSIFALASAFVAGCGSKPAEENQTSIDTNLVDSNSQILDAVDELLTKLPRPSEIPNLIAMTGADFKIKLLNPLENAEKISENRSKSAFSIGVYSADVAYMAAYDKGQDAIKTFVVGKKLAERVGVASAFDQTIVTRIEKNLNNRDSLISISDNSMRQSTNLLRTNEQLKEASLVAAGGLIEGIFLACGLIHDYPPTGLPQKEQDRILVPLVNSVINQEKTLNGLIELLNKINDNDADLTAIITKLNVAKDIYAKANWPQKMAENKGNMIPSEKDIHELAVAIADIRNSLTK